MSSFTQRLTITATPSHPARRKGWMPPGFQRPKWRVWIGFDYAVGDLDQPREIITVPGSFEFDGASVPLPFRLFVPMAHPDYIQAAALHDWMLSQPGRYSRRYADQVFHEALGVLGMPPFWRAVMFAAVSCATFRARARKILKG